MTLLPDLRQVYRVMLDIRALLYLAELRAQSQGNRTVDQFSADVDAHLAQVRERLGN